MSRPALCAAVAAVMFLAAWFVPAGHSSDLSRADSLVHTFASAATVTCDPAIGTQAFGLTYYPSRVVLSPFVCLGLFLFDAPTGYRRAVQRLNPSVDVERAIGVGVLVTLHEAQHAAGIRSETVAECRAMRYAQPLLAVDPAAWTQAQLYDLSLPAGYHDGPCDAGA